MKHTYKNVMVNTELGPRPFTDLFIRYNDKCLYSRFHGTLSQFDIKQFCEMTKQRLKKEGKL